MLWRHPSFVHLSCEEKIGVEIPKLVRELDSRGRLPQKSRANTSRTISSLTTDSYDGKLSFAGTWHACLANVLTLFMLGHVKLKHSIHDCVSYRHGISENRAFTVKFYWMIWNNVAIPKSVRFYKGLCCVGDLTLVWHESVFVGSSFRVWCGCID